MFGGTSICDESSLRSAIERGGLIEFKCDTAIEISRPLTISKDTILDASGFEVVLSGGDRVRIIEVNPGAKLTLKHLTLTRGFIAGDTNNIDPVVGDAEGAAILSYGSSLTSVLCTFRSNRVVGARGFVASSFESFPTSNRGGHALGGAVSVRSGVAKFDRCYFEGNRTEGGRGGAFENGPPTSESTSEGGQAYGGGLYSIGASLTLNQCWFLGNQVFPGLGGKLSSAGSFYTTGATGSGRGGAVYCGAGQSEISFCGFTSNEVVVSFSRSERLQGGGAIYIGEGELTLQDTVLSNNNVRGGLGSLGVGGGVMNEGRLVIQRSRFQSNGVQGSGADIRGGGLFNKGECRLDFSVFDSNRAQGGYWFYSYLLIFPGQGKGGAIFNSGHLIANSSTFLKNQAQAGGDPHIFGETFGGGVFNSGEFRATNVSFLRNATQPAGTFGDPKNPSNGGYGGAIFNDGTTLLVHSTVAANTLLSVPSNPNNPSLGGGIFSTNGSVTLFNTLLQQGAHGSNCFGLVTDGGGNLSSDKSCQFGADRTGIDLKLGPLRVYENGVPVVVLLPGSPAIDSGLPLLKLVSDARGSDRPFGLGVDTGAFESHGEEFENQLWVEKTVSGQKRILYFDSKLQPRGIESSIDLEHWMMESLAMDIQDGLYSWVVPPDESRGQLFFRIRLE